ncbi:unnamed protein product [marine sediment metagenome]|uniref:Uncharacterized protein n=1 Tax=marine sediment metagenome TaxID=412755 RepID=X0ZD65_9ZZZZ
MNGVRVEYEASLKQTAKGVWYVDTIRCGDDSIEGLGAKLHLMMMEVEAQLERHNFVEPKPEKKEE